MRTLTRVFMATVELAAGGRAAFDGRAGRSGFLYVVRGAIEVAGTPARQFTLVELADDGDRVELRAAEDALLLFGHAAPHGEPVVATARS